MVRLLHSWPHSSCGCPHEISISASGGAAHEPILPAKEPWVVGGFYGTVSFLLGHGPGRSTPLQWMAPYPRLHWQHRLNSVCYFKKEHEVGIGWGWIWEQLEGGAGEKMIKIRCMYIWNAQKLNENVTLKFLKKQGQIWILYRSKGECNSGEQFWRM